MRNELLEIQNILHGDIDIAKAIYESIYDRTKHLQNIDLPLHRIKVELDSYQRALRAHCRSVDMLLGQVSGSCELVRVMLVLMESVLIERAAL